jgi:hypothetical protein
LTRQRSLQRETVRPRIHSTGGETKLKSARSAPAAVQKEFSFARPFRILPD